MSSATLYAAIRARLDADWTATSVAYENEPFTIPADSAGMPQPWLMVEITGQMLDQRSIGAGARTDNLWREVGSLVLHLFVPRNTGSATARTLMRQAADLFMGTDLGTTTFGGASIGLGDTAEVNGTWWRLTASIAFETDE